MMAMSFQCRTQSKVEKQAHDNIVNHFSHKLFLVGKAWEKKSENHNIKKNKYR